MFIHRYRIVIQLTEPALLPEYKGSMFRGAFGWAFRKAVCVTQRPDCEGCLLRGVCSYFKVFETEVPEGNSIPFMNGVKKTPHPYILTPPLDNKRNYEKGEELTIELTLFGETVNLLPFFAYSFQQMGSMGIGFQRNRFILRRIILLGNGGTEFDLFDERSQRILPDKDPIPMMQVPEGDVPSQITLRFMTPYRAQENARIITHHAEITPQLILNAIKRRYIVLSSLYGSGPGMDIADVDAEDLVVTSNMLYFKDWERYSNRQQTKMSMGGMLGTIGISGNLAPYWQLLKTGEYIHIGKNAVFGLGKFTVEH